MTRTLDWSFPLPRTHTGIPLGNGRTGLLIWGSGSMLCITLSRADLWDHRGGMPWTERQNFTDIRQFLEAGNEAGIRDIFRPAQDAPAGTPSRPTVMPFGRLEITLAAGCTLTTGTLALEDGIVTVAYRVRSADESDSGRRSDSAESPGSGYRSIQILLHPERDVALLRGTQDLAAVRPATSWDLMREKLEAVGHIAPQSFKLNPDGRHDPAADSEALADSDAGDLAGDARLSGGWFAALPEDPGAWAAWQEQEDTLLIATGRAASLKASRDGAVVELGGTSGARKVTAADEIEEKTVGWWRRYWRGVSRVGLPNRTLQEIHDYGLYLFAGLTNPAGLAATLQGPWIEEYDFPPWSSDYHFNINVQMCYSPAFRSGALEHLHPLFDKVWSWRDELRANARHFVGIEDGYMLPHAVDDRATCMGSFWTGTIDHACTAWVAQMMYDYADYSGDDAFLRGVALPFMKGTFAVYRAMLEDGGGVLRMPVSVSPEYRGSAMNAWGANASFQLAALRRLAENLIAAAEALGEDASPAWADVIDRLPLATLIGAEGKERIALWEGVDLEESHRHHSHLGSIAPFVTIDPFDEKWRPIVERSLAHWVRSGMGMWSGWCMSWASQLHSRIGNGEGAELLLEIWKRVFTNEGRASMHDVVMNGLTLMGAPPLVPPQEQTDSADGGAADRDSAGGGGTGGSARAERMQMDGAMGGVAAVQEMLLHDRRGTLIVFGAIPARWTGVSFERMRAPGGFVVSGWWNGPGDWRVEVEATRDGVLKLIPPSEGYSWTRGHERKSSSGRFELPMDAADELIIVAEGGDGAG